MIRPVAEELGFRRGDRQGDFQQRPVVRAGEPGRAVLRSELVVAAEEAALQVEAFAGDAVGLDPGADLDLPAWGHQQLRAGQLLFGPLSLRATKRIELWPDRPRRVEAMPLLGFRRFKGFKGSRCA